MDILTTLAAFSACIALLFMIKSILVFDPTDLPPTLYSFLTRVHQGKNDLEWDVSRLPSQQAAVYIIIALGLLWSILGAALLLAAHVVAGPKLGYTYCSVSAACFTIAAFTTYGLGGHLQYRSRPGSSRDSPQRPSSSVANEEERTAANIIADSSSTALLSPLIKHDSSGLEIYTKESMPALSEWRFWQPFKGGTVFVATQAAGWLLFSATLALLLTSVISATLGVAHCLSHWTVAAGASGMAAEIIIALSLATYNARDAEHRTALLEAAKLFKVHRIKAFVSHVGLMTMLYIPVHVIVSTVTLSYLILPPIIASTLYIGALVVYYSITGLSGPEHTGQREWRRFGEWLGREAERCLKFWLGNFEVRVDPKAEFISDSTKKYVFGYAPHGLYPLGAAYLPWTPSFRKLVPLREKPVTLTASVVFQIPILRDLLLWCGARVVARSTFVHALRERGSVVMVPGGQAELVEAYRAATTATKAVASPDNGLAKHRVCVEQHENSTVSYSRNSYNQPSACVLYTRHHGFVRVAIQEKACLCPIVVFGEITSLRNLIHAPALQRWTYKLFGFPTPYLIGGKWSILPFPSPSGLRFVVGRPIEPPTEEELAKGGEEAAVIKLHTAFYDQVQELWDEHKRDFRGYEEMPLIRDRYARRGLKERLRRLYNIADTKGDGKIDPQELANFLKSLGYRSPSKSVVENMIWEVDEDHDGNIGWDEWERTYDRCINDMEGKEPRQLHNVVLFALYSSNTSVSKNNKDSAMTSLTRRMSLEDAGRLMYLQHGREELDAHLLKTFGDVEARNGRGLTVEEFIQCMNARQVELRKLGKGRKDSRSTRSRNK